MYDTFLCVRHQSSQTNEMIMIKFFFVKGDLIKLFLSHDSRKYIHPTNKSQIWNGLPVAVFPGLHDLGTFKRRVYFHLAGRNAPVAPLVIHGAVGGGDLLCIPL